MKKSIKSFEEVVIGELAYENPDAGGNWNNVEGPIIWKGTSEELDKSEFSYLVDEWDEEIFEDGDDFNFAVVKNEMYGNTLFLYDYDPSSVVCFK